MCQKLSPAICDGSIFWYFFNHVHTQPYLQSIYIILSFTAMLFSGHENAISLTREYYHDYACDFELSFYPFDTQVSILSSRTLFCFFFVFFVKALGSTCLLDDFRMTTRLLLERLQILANLSMLQLKFEVGTNADFEFIILIGM